MTSSHKGLKKRSSRSTLATRSTLSTRSALKLPAKSKFLKQNSVPDSPDTVSSTNVSKIESSTSKKSSDGTQCLFNTIQRVANLFQLSAMKGHQVRE